jgi:hypothetical protein
MDIEGRTLITELLAPLAKQEWEYPFLEAFLLLAVLAPVHKCVLGSRMAVEIAVEGYMTRF